MKFFIHIVLLLIFTNSIKAEPIYEQLIGTWRGEASFNDEKTRLAIQFYQDSSTLKAKISLMDIGVSGWPASKISVTSNGVNLVLPSDSGPQHLELTLLGRSLSGTWNENNYKVSASVNLLHAEKPLIQPAEKRITLQGKAGVIGASLFIPEGEGPFPAVIFLHGSGATTRDANRFPAERFVEQGIASLIFDKRGVGESKGNLEGVTFSELADDAVTAANYMNSLKKISSVGFSGHSQGGWVAPIAAVKWEHTAFVITSAGPAVSPAREGEWEFVYPMISTKDSEEIIPKIRKIVSVWHQGLRTSDWQKFDSFVSKYSDSKWFKKAGLDSLMSHPDENFATSYRAFMDYEPIPTLKALKSPMLSIYALDDESIDSKESIAIISKLISLGLNIKLKLYSGYSHSMRKASEDDTPLRFPNHPQDYFTTQAQFIHDSVRQ